MTALAAVSLALFVVGQAADPAAAAPAGRKFGIDEPVPARFSVTTNAGTITGTINVVRLEARGIEGWGAFEIRGEVDPWSISTGDPVLDRHVARTILRGREGSITFASVERLPPRRPAADGEAAPDDGLPGARFYLDARRGGRPVEVRYQATVDGDSARLKLTHEAPLAALGLPPSTHPFVEVTGPVVLALDAPLTRRR